MENLIHVLNLQRVVLGKFFKIKKHSKNVSIFSSIFVGCPSAHLHKYYFLFHRLPLTSPPLNFKKKNYFRTCIALQTKVCPNFIQNLY